DISYNAEDEIQQVLTQYFGNSFEGGGDSTMQDWIWKSREWEDHRKLAEITGSLVQRVAFTLKSGKSCADDR
ncbi:unnamed protein product, partial [Prorocentrum cordatum]